MIYYNTIMVFSKYSFFFIKWYWALAKPLLFRILHNKERLEIHIRAVPIVWRQNS